MPFGADLREWWCFEAQGVIRAASVVVSSGRLRSVPLVPVGVVLVAFARAISRR